MKKFGKYYRNPTPFALTAVNPAKKKRRKRRAAVTHLAAGSPAKSRRRRKKNPAALVRRKVGTSRWHHKRGTFLYNPAKKRRKNALRKKRRRNPLEIQHVIADVPSRNPARRKIRKKSRRKNPSNPMSKHRKRRRKASRNPVRRATRRRSSRRRRNPSRRGFLRRMRNPAIVSDLIDKTNVKRGVGVLAGIGGTRFIVNKLIQGDPVTGQRMFDLPGVVYSTPTAPLTQAQFTEKNKVALAVYETLIPAVAGWFVRRYDSAISEGLLGAAVANAGIAMLRTSQFGQTAGLNAFLPRQKGLQTYIPGVPPMLSGPATAFINNGAPVARGMNAVVNPQWHARAVANVANPFSRS